MAHENTDKKIGDAKYAGGGKTYTETKKYPKGGGIKSGGRSPAYSPAGNRGAMVDSMWNDKSSKV